jgi:type III restriction enzyme
MENPFFERPILNSPYECPRRHWELDEHGQPTQQLLDSRRPAQFITPIPKPRKRKGATDQQTFAFDEVKELATEGQKYDTTSNINEVRREVDRWRALPASGWGVTPETARLLQHWRTHPFAGVRPFFWLIRLKRTLFYESQRS